RTSSQDSSRAMSNWSALSDIESGFQPCDVQLGRSIGHRVRIPAVQCPIGAFYRTSSQDFRRAMSNWSNLLDTESGFRLCDVRLLNHFPLYSLNKSFSTLPPFKTT